MANLSTFFKQEISRVARKELRSETETLKKSSARYRSDIAELKRKVSALEQQVARQVKMLASSGSPQETMREEKPVRFSAAGLKKMREKKGLSAAVMGKILRVTPQTIYNWEAGTTRPGKEQLLAIATIRATGKRELASRLQVV